MQQVAEVTELMIYPVKSCAGINVSTIDIDAFGPRWDRRWVIIDQEGVFISQRKIAKLATIKTALSTEELSLTLSNGEVLKLDLRVAPHGSKVASRVWQDTVLASDAGIKAQEFLSDFLGIHARLVFMTDDSPRIRHKERTFHASFVDSMPALLCSNDSLAELNSYAQKSIPMSRFRPNIVISGATPYAEDNWESIKIGNVHFPFGKDCDRCIVPAIDQESGKRGSSEVLLTLNAHRRRNNAVFFGKRFVHSNGGTIKIGDAVYV